jgi:hypothetical protein
VKHAAADWKSIPAGDTEDGDGANNSKIAKFGGNVFMIGKLINLADEGISIITDFHGAQGTRGEEGGNEEGRVQMESMF